MEPQIIDYYNEEPLIMKIIGNLNSQFSELQKEYYILKKEFGKFLSMISLGQPSGSRSNDRTVRSHC